MTARTLSLAFIVLWLLAGLYFVLRGLQYQLGTISSPGTGFMPFVVGLILIGFGILSLIPFLVPAPAPASEPEPMTLQRLRDPAIVVATMLAYAFALERIGFIVSTGVLVAFLTWCVGRTTLIRGAVAGVLATVACYVVFGRLLGVPLP